MALGEHPLRVGLIDHAVGGAAAGFLLDVVVRRVERLAAVDAAGVVPIEAVVCGSGHHPGAHAVVATAQQREFLVDRAGNLTLEAEAAGVDRPVVERDRRVSRI